MVFYIDQIVNSFVVYYLNRVCSCMLNCCFKVLKLIKFYAESRKNSEVLVQTALRIFFSNRACKFVSILLKLEASNLPTLEELYVGKYNGVMEILTFFNYFNQSPYNRPAES